MDFHLKQWKAQQQQQQEQESDTTNHHHLLLPSAKIPKLALIETTSPHLHHSNSTLPLFVPAEQEEPSSATSSRFPRMGSSSSSSSNFSWVQWQELELQALIYRYMIAGAAVPPELLQPIKKSLLHSPYFLHYSGQYQSPAAWYWGRGSMDPEPGRCRRTDGKKWRCSRDVVGGQKYCERHMHRGRNRSRKPVEVSAASSLGGGTSATAAHLQAAPAGAGAGGGGTHFALSGSSPQSIDLFQSYSSEPTQVEEESKGGPFDDRSDGRVLRHFFDDWPRSIQDSDNGTRSSTSLSISMPGNGNPSSDVSLKLSTGIGDEPRNPEQQQQQMGNWGPSGWGPTQVASMGGPLAEALRSSSATAHSSPTSVLHHLPRGSRASEASFVTA